MSVSYSVNEVKKIVSAVSVLFLKLIYHGTSTTVHLLILKFSMAWSKCSSWSKKNQKFSFRDISVFLHELESQTSYKKLKRAC